MSKALMKKTEQVHERKLYNNATYLPDTPKCLNRCRKHLYIELFYGCACQTRHCSA